MTRRQRLRRYLWWRSFTITLFLFAGYIGALGLADHITRG